MKKILLVLLLAFVIVVGFVYFLGSSLLSKGIKAAVETYGPKVTQTPVTLDAVSLSILSGSGSLEGLNVGNPEGYKAENIFALGRVDLDLAPMSVLDEIIVINKVHILQPEISYEKGLRGSNLNEILANIESFTGTEEEAPDQAPETPAKPGKKVFIKSLIIEEGSVHLGVLGQGQQVPLPRIEMNDLGAREDGSGQTGSEVAAAIIGEILQTVTRILADPEMMKKLADPSGLQNVGDSAVEGAGKAVEGIKNLFGK